MSKKIPFLIALAYILVQLFSSIGVIGIAPIFYYNVTASEPIGIYKVVPMDVLKDGDMVHIKVPENVQDIVYSRSWLIKGQLMLKTVYALPGDQYSITDQEIFVKGTYIGPVFEVDRLNRPMPQIRGSFTVNDGYFLPLASRLPNSFDGRYFGEISKDLIVNKVVPFITFPEGIF